SWGGRRDGRRPGSSRCTARAVSRCRMLPRPGSCCGAPPSPVPAGRSTSEGRLAMDVFVSIDMEGVAGIAHIRQVMRGTDDYPAARELMTREANAASTGAFDGGATRVVVNDWHGDMTNVLPEALDPRAELTIGSPKVRHSM